jgi:hypothetical protein
VDGSAHSVGDAVSVAGWGTSWPVEVAGGEATVKACGVAVAMLQEHRWGPTPSKGSAVNVGTAAVVRAWTTGSGWPVGTLVVSGCCRGGAEDP